MSVSAIAGWASLALGVGGAVYSANKAGDVQSQNAAAQAAAQKDYERRIKAAGKEAAKLLEQYNEIKEQRPDLSWEAYIRNYIRAIDDPAFRDAYLNNKSEDFDKLLEFAQAATEGNTDNLLQTFDKINNGRGREILDARLNAIMETNAADRFARAFELYAPLRTGVGTVRYDNEGRLIAGQRAEMQGLNLALEQQTEIEREFKQDIAQLERDRLNAAQSQQQRATEFTNFYDPTGLAVNLEGQRFAMENARQMHDEQLAFNLYSAFAQAAAGITPTQPNYQSSDAYAKLFGSSLDTAMKGLSQISANNK